jgi:hypothetical protein
LKTLAFIFALPLTYLRALRNEYKRMTGSAQVSQGGAR